MKRLSLNLPQSALLTIYKYFIRSGLECGDILYDKPDNEHFQNKIEKRKKQDMFGNNWYNTRNFKRKTL